MRYQIAVLLLVIGVGVGAVLAVPATPANEQSKIQDLITLLGSENFRQRDAATKELDAIGDPALEALRKAAKNSDMEVANRAAALIAKIEQRGETARLLAPTYVQLSLKEATVDEAVAELAKKSGYTIVLGGDKAKMVDRRVTLETGKVSFWKALDLLCEKAGLVEGDPTTVGQADPTTQPVLPQIQVRPLPAQIRPIQIKPVQVKPVEKEDSKPVDPKPNAPQGFSADDNAEKAKKEEEEAKRREEDAKKAAEQAEAAKRAAQAQLQLQLQARQLQLGRPATRVQQQSTIVLVDGKSEMPSSTDSAIRVRPIAKDHPQFNQSPIPDGEVGIQLEVRAEPKLQVQQILGVKIDKALDNYDQTLTQMAITNTSDPAANDLNAQQQLKLRIIQQQQGFVTYPAGSGQTVFPIRLKKSDKASKSIKELRGEVSLRIRTPIEELAAIENVLKAKGESIKGKNGTSLKIVDIEKLANGDVKVIVDLQYSTEITPINNSTANQAILLNGLQVQGQIQIQIAPQAVPPQGGVAVAASGTTYSGLQLLDDMGTPITMQQVQSGRTTASQGGRTVSATLIFRPKKDQEAAKIAFKGTRLASVDVPFLLKDIPVK